MLILLAALCFDSPGSGYREPVQPYEVHSASGSWRAAVNPSSKYGAGPCNVRVERDNVVAWERELPVTLFESVVTNAGRLAGYGHTSGFGGRDKPGEFVVLILDSSGAVLLDERTRSVEDSESGASSVRTRPAGLMLDVERERLTLRLHITSREPLRELWRRYSLTEPARLSTIDPLAHNFAQQRHAVILSATQILGAPLVLVEWNPFDGGNAKPPARRFVLLDDDGAPVWTRDVQQRAPKGDSFARAMFAGRSTMLGAPAPHRFELLHGADKARVTYEVEHEAATGTWRVVEVARAAWNGEDAVLIAHNKRPSVPQVRVTSRELELLDIVAPDVERRERDWNSGIVAFEPRANGTLRFARCLRRGEFEFGFVDARGQLTRRIAFEPPDSLDGGVWCALAGERWLAVEPARKHAGTMAWIIDGASGATAQLAHFPNVEEYDFQLAAAPDGGFAVLGMADVDRVACNALVRWDARGAVVWARGTSAAALDFDSGEFKPAPAAFEDADDLAFGADGALYVLLADAGEVLTFDAGGELGKRIRLVDPAREEKAAENTESEEDWESDRDWSLQDLLVLPTGGMLIYDWRGAPSGTWRRFDNDGRLLEGHGVRRAGGEIDVAETRSFVLDAKGVLWSSLHDEILSYDSTGKATTRFGAPLATDALHLPLEPSFDELGRLRAIDELTLAIFLFDADGARAARVDVASELRRRDRDLNLAYPSLRSGPDGRQLLQFSERRNEWFVLDAAGKRVASLDLGGNLVAWRSDGGFWTVDSEADVLRQRTPHGDVVRTLERHPSGLFFESIDALALGPDDGVAIAALAGHAASLVLYDRDGKHLRTLATPGRVGEPLHWRGDWLVYRDGERNWLLASLRSGEFNDLEAPVDADERYAWGMSPDGREAWRAQTNPLRVRRFALPE